MEMRASGGARIRLTQTESPPVRGMLEASRAIMIRTGMLMIPEITVAVTMSAPGNRVRAANTPQASVAPTGAENTALKIVASSALASRTRPVL